MFSFSAVLASAGVAAFISGLITVIDRYFERKSRRRELLLQQAIEMAKSRTDRILQIAKDSRMKATI